MIRLVPTKSIWTSIVYVISIFQATSIYALVVHFDGWDSLLQSVPFVGQQNRRQSSSPAIESARVASFGDMSQIVTPGNVSILSHQIAPKSSNGILGARMGMGEVH